MFFFFSILAYVYFKILFSLAKQRQQKGNFFWLLLDDSNPNYAWIYVPLFEVQNNVCCFYRCEKLDLRMTLDNSCTSVLSVFLLSLYPCDLYLTDAHYEVLSGAMYSFIH